MSDIYQLTAAQIEANLHHVRENIAQACARSGRSVSEVRLCAVSKLKSVEDIRTAMEAGQPLFGENYVQEIRDKYAQIGDACEWHMIGHLQRNKVKYLIDMVDMIESVDSIDLARQIEKEASKRGCVMDVLLEVNVAGEESKYGFKPEEVLEAAEEIGDMDHVWIRGLMTSAPYTEDPETNRVHFRVLKRLFDQLDNAGLPGVQADTLSMGMTGDYTVAVEEGATLLRVGTGIFGQRDYSK